MADVRGASGVPGTGQFDGITTPSPCTPLYVDTATGDLYVLLNNTVTLVGQIAAGASYTLANRVFAQRSDVPATLVNDANQAIANRVFAQRVEVPSAELGDASEILASRVFRSGQPATTWMA